MTDPALQSSAILSDCGTYRYTLHRFFPADPNWGKVCLFVMLNPSTADAKLDDNTIRRCMGFARRERCRKLTVVNLFALRATDPKKLQGHPDPRGPNNLIHVYEQIDYAKQNGVIIAAWGSDPMARILLTAAIKSKLRGAGAMCLGMTKDGSPRHPLYLKSDAPLILWK